MKTKNFIIGGTVAALIIGGGIWYNSTLSSSTKLVSETSVMLPSTFNNAKGKSNTDFWSLSLLNATPTTVDKNGKIINYAASKIDLSKDALKLKITLKDNLKYEDGTNVVAQDYISAIKMLANQQTKSDYASFATQWIQGAQDYFDGKSKEISGLKVIDDKTYEITLIKPGTFYKNILASEVFAPVKQSRVDKLGGYKTYGSKASDVLSSGEYKIKKYAKEQYLEFEKNDKTSLSTSLTPKEFKMVKSPTLTDTAKLYKQGKVNSVLKGNVTDKTLGKAKSAKPDSEEISPAMTYLATSGVSANIAKAMYLAIDKDYVVNKIYYGEYKLTNSLVPQNYSEINAKIPDVNKIKFNLEEAKKLVAAEGKKVTIRFMSKTPSGPQTMVFTKYLINQWKSIGLDVVETPKPMELGAKLSFGPQNKDREYEAQIVSWMPDYEHASSYYNYVLGSNSITTYGRWEGAKAKEYDKLVNEAIVAKDENKANELYAKADILRANEGKLQTIYESANNRYIKDGGFKTFGWGHLLKPSLWEKK